ncbi:MAG: 4-(cytidine 5'-diphospho)-2-C-methyl-D-erythritol kinase [Bacteroidales bacterium]|nr:4-(cytidine 5'-diphospho)-2-C-methyl-D-erythritol kinase [Bacteroidales bacterium]
MITRPHVKINLGLNVLRKRPDGYHDLETLFVPYYGYHDTLEIIPGDGWSETSAALFARYGGEAGETPCLAQAIRPDGKVMVTIARAEGVDWDPLKDLTVKAYGLLEADFKLPPVKIFLEKTSPVGAGLGGGSADAAFALRMYRDLFALDVSDEDLSTYAAALGSDCALFLHEGPVFGEGRGEVLTPYELDLSAYDLQVIVPEGIAVSTADAYRGIVPAMPAEPLHQVLQRPVTAWKDLLVNDFEKTVFAKYPQLAAIKQSLYDSGAVYAAMSGSGSALFALYNKD